MQNILSTLPMMFRRGAAFLYDCLLLVALFFIITAIAVAFNHGNAIQNFAYYLLLFIIGFLFFDWFWRHGGQTLGMRAWRIKVEGIDKQTITFRQSVLRYVTGFLLFGVTLLSIPFSAQRTALHDQLSKTRIINIYN